LLKRKVSTERNTLALLDSLNTAKVCESAAKRRPYFLPSFNTERICSEEDEDEEEEKRACTSKAGDFILARVLFSRNNRELRAASMSSALTLISIDDSMKRVRCIYFSTRMFQLLSLYVLPVRASSASPVSSAGKPGGINIVLTSTRAFPLFAISTRRR